MAGAIAGPGRAIVPSIEDKVVRFADRDRHKIFLEPEGLDDRHGLSRTASRPACPRRSRARLLATIPGLEHARMISAGLCGRIRLRRSARADAVAGGAAAAGAVPGRPDQRHDGLRGSGGAGADGRGQCGPSGRRCGATVLLARAEAYIGVLIDDLTTQGVNEPYRMFTSRAEFRSRCVPTMPICG